MDLICLRTLLRAAASDLSPSTSRIFFPVTFALVCCVGEGADVCERCLARVMQPEREHVLSKRKKAFNR